jgi:dipeptidase E
MSLNIVAIGGGDVKSGETIAIDRRFVNLADKAKPNLLFIPTASQDSEAYIESVQSSFGGRLGCEVDTLRLWNVERWLPSIVRKLESADLIYVGGGNTKAMLEKWRELGVDRELRRIISKGTPVGGVSAGAICWFRVGNSDWPQFEQVPGVLTDRLDCLGIVDLVVCPHARCETFRLGDFKKMMQAEKGVGIALDDCCALQVKDDTYRFISSASGSGAHIICGGEGDHVFEFVESHDDFRPLDELRKRYHG